MTSAHDICKMKETDTVVFYNQQPNALTSEHISYRKGMHMTTTLIAIFLALQTAPLITIAITIPFAAFHYTKNKSLNVRWFTCFYIFILYYLCAYFMTILPLPTPEALEKLRPVGEMIQLIPFKNFFDIKAETFLHDAAILVFNLFLTVPLGFFLRYLFRCSRKKAITLGFLTSLLYEITQLTGLFFIYPRPYRFFDIDDLMVNTLGAWIGYLIVPYILRFLPSLSADDQKLAPGSEVSFFHRCTATAIDFCLVLCVSIAGIVYITPLKDLFSQSSTLGKFPLFYILFLAVGVIYSMLLKGGTLGTKLMHLRLMAKGGMPIPRIRCSLRFALICICVIAIPYWIYFFMTVNTEYAGAKSILWVFFGTVFMVFAAAILLEMMFNAVTHGSSMFYDRFFHAYLAYGKNRSFSVLGIRVMDIKPLTPVNVEGLSKELCDTLYSMGVPRESVTKVRLMTEGVMLDWIANGLGDIPCELRLDRRYHRKMLMLSVSGENKSNALPEDSYADMLKGLNLTIETYYAAEKNICNILIP